MERDQKGPACGPAHIFLTGQKRVGKSTLIGKYLRDFQGRVGGFRTVRTDSVCGVRYSVHLLRPGQEPGEENLLFLCGEPRDEAVWARFDRLGCAALEDTEDYDLILMDELGPAEANAKAFQQAVLRALDGRTPILGVLQKAESPFLRQIAAHPRVTVLEITADNRDKIQIK